MQKDRKTGSNPTQPKTTLYNFGTTVLSIVGHAVSAPGADCMLGYFPLPAATLPQTFFLSHFFFDG